MPLVNNTDFYSAERVLRDDDRPLEILQEWGPHQDQVKFVLRYTVIPSAMNGEYCHVLDWSTTPAFVTSASCSIFLLWTCR